MRSYLYQYDVHPFNNRWGNRLLTPTCYFHFERYGVYPRGGDDCVLTFCRKADVIKL